MDIAIRLRGVSKSFGPHRAVEGLDLDVPRGSLYGFIGPNGSGKTTTLRMILDILLPDQGSVEVLGSRDTRAVRDRVALPARGARALQEDDRPAAPPVLRVAQGGPAAGTGRGDRRLARPDGPGGVDRQEDRRAFQGDGPEGPVHRLLPGEPRGRRPRRAVHGPRPGQRRGPEGRGPRPQEGRDHRRLLDARHGRRRAVVRPDLHDPQGAQGPRRHPRRDPGRARRRHDPPEDRRRPVGAGGDRRRRRGQRPGEPAGGPLRGRPAGTAEDPGRADARSSTSRSPARRSTTSSSGSPTPTARTSRSPSRHERPPDLRDRHDRVRHGDPHQVVLRRHPDAADHHGGLDRPPEAGGRPGRHPAEAVRRPRPLGDDRAGPGRGRRGPQRRDGRRGRRGDRPPLRAGPGRSGRGRRRRQGVAGALGPGPRRRTRRLRRGPGRSRPARGRRRGPVLLRQPERHRPSATG